MGSVEQAAAWMKLMSWTGELYVDTSTDGNVTALNQSGSKPYSSFKLSRGLDELRLNDARASEFSQSIEHMDLKQIINKDDYSDADSGEVQIWPGDVFQIGGAFVVGPGNVCDYAFRSLHAGDDPSLSDLYKFATRTSGEGGDHEIVFESTKVRSEP